MPPFNERWVGNAGQLDKCLTFINERIVDLMEVKEGHELMLETLPPIPGAGAGGMGVGKTTKGGGTKSSGGGLAEGSAFL